MIKGLVFVALTVLVCVAAGAMIGEAIALSDPKSHHAFAVWILIGGAFGLFAGALGAAIGED